MTAPIITNPNTSSTINIGKVIQEENEIRNELVKFSLPFASTRASVVANVMGKMRIISLLGIHTGEGYSGSTNEDKINNFISDMELWINNGIQTHRVYTDSLGHEYDVICLSFNYTRDLSPGRITYQMVLYEGDISFDF